MCRLHTRVCIYICTRWYNAQCVSFHLSVDSVSNPRGQSKQPLFIVSVLQQPHRPRVTHNIIIFILSRMRTVMVVILEANILIRYNIIWSVSFFPRPSRYTL